MNNELIDRNCEKCVHHLSGYCDSWDCNMQTVDDVKKEAVNEYIKAVVKELDEYIAKIVGRKSALYQTIMKIVKRGGKHDI